jgi:hypothetical protein
MILPSEMELVMKDVSEVAPRKKIEAMVLDLAKHFTPNYGDLTTDEDGATVFAPREKE